MLFSTPADHKQHHLIHVHVLVHRGLSENGLNSHTGKVPLSSRPVAGSGLWLAAQSMGARAMEDGSTYAGSDQKS
ncbi:hypothetical protein VTK56DRAFT_2760 [Thermocarpiscus australiensis]